MEQTASQSISTKEIRQALDRPGIRVFRRRFDDGVLAFYLRARWGARLVIGLGVPAAQRIALKAQAVSLYAAGARFHIWF